MLNVFIGFEQSNKYTISTLLFCQECKELAFTDVAGSVDGELLGYIAEEPKGFWGILSRQAFATHRPFRAVIMDKEGSPVLWGCLIINIILRTNTWTNIQYILQQVRRPFAWINSRMFVQRLKDRSGSSFEVDPVRETFGDVQQIWHLWRRRYDLFLL